MGAGRGRVAELMDKAADQWTIQELAAALQTAVELEVSTLPPYFCGFWSVTDPTAEAAQLIKSVQGEEMLHLGLVCNMLVALGPDYSPQLVSTMPTYPGPLPGGVRPGLTVCLGGLTLERVSDVYMQIEYPEDGPVAADADAPPTIGSFYDAIAIAFYALVPSLDTSRQLTQDEVGVFVMNSLADVLRAIGEIKEQGEGTSQSPDAVDFGGELAHYYRFGEIYNGKKLEQGPDGKWAYTGADVPFPDVYPMAEVPSGGWQDAAPDVRSQLDEFNKTFTQLLTDLEAAWAPGGGSDKLDDAIGDMVALAQLGPPLMQIPLPPPATGNYGPEWRVVT